MPFIDPHTAARPSLLGLIVGAEIEALGGLAPNWDGYGAPRIDPAVIGAAKAFVGRLLDNIAPRPRVVPTSNGSIRVEWHDGPKLLDLEFETSRSIRSLRWNPRSGVDEEEVFSAKDTDTAADMIRWLVARPIGR